MHYAWVIAGVTFVVLLATAGIRATPGVLIVPFEAEFGWTRTAISFAIAVNIALFGAMGPFAASAMQRWGVRRLVVAALLLLGTAVALTTRMQAPWHLLALWGIAVGVGTGMTSLVLAAVVSTRWFDARRGVVLGALTAANATGQLIFLPTLASLTETQGWRSATWLVAAVAAVTAVVAAMFLRDRPSDVGLRAYGASPDAAPDLTPPLSPFAALRLAARSRAFWVLGGTFFICGASTVGLIGTHLIAACHDHGIASVHSARLLAMMGLFDILGTTASGWLTDRYSSRHLLFAYYTLRGVSLLFLPHTFDQGMAGLGVFAVFYGLDWVATVPPTVKLTTETFGARNTGVIYGWIGASHQIGASLAAFASGYIRTATGDYALAFWLAGGLCVIAGFTFLASGRRTFSPASTLSVAATA